MVVAFTKNADVFLVRRSTVHDCVNVRSTLCVSGHRMLVFGAFDVLFSEELPMMRGVSMISVDMYYVRELFFGLFVVRREESVMRMVEFEIWVQRKLRHPLTITQSFLANVLHELQNKLRT